MIPVHIILFFLRHGRIILFPECDCPKIQHAAPVGTDLVQNFCQFSHLAQYIQLKEVKVWCCDCRNFIIFEYVFEYFFLLLFVCDIKQNCKNIRMSCHITFTRSEGIDICTLFFIPEKFLNGSSQFFIVLPVSTSVLTKLFADFCHHTETCCIKHLFRTERTIFIHISPVNIYPVFFFSDQKTMLLSPAITKIHKGHHLWINQFQKFSVAISFIVIIHPQEPQQRVIYNCIDVLCHRVIAAKCQNRSLIDFCICHQITIYKKALVCIS